MLVGQNQLTGYAVFYADYFQGRKTANGEIYDAMKYTAASRNFPFGTILKVTRLNNQGLKTNAVVYVRVNDRGPYAKECPECILDLSWQAADDIGLVLDGKAAVLLEKVGHSKEAISGSLNNYSSSGYPSAPSSSRPNQAITSYSYKAPSKVKIRQARPSSYQSSSNFVQGGSTLRSKGVGNSSIASAVNTPVENKKEEVVIFGYNSESAVIPQAVSKPVSPIRSNLQGYGIQIASYVDRSNAIRYFQSLEAKGLDDVYIITSDYESKTLFKIIKGQFSSRSDAERELARLKQETKYRGYILLLSK